jgi:hypothetical protein
VHPLHLVADVDADAMLYIILLQSARAQEAQG